MPDREETWTEDDDKRYAQRVAELYLNGEPEATVENKAAAEINADRNKD